LSYQLCHSLCVLLHPIGHITGNLHSLNAPKPAVHYGPIAMVNASIRAAV